MFIRIYSHNGFRTACHARASLASAEFRACIFPLLYPRVHVACSLHTLHMLKQIASDETLKLHRGSVVSAEKEQMLNVCSMAKNHTFEAFGLELCVEIVTLFQSGNGGEFSSCFD